MRLSRCNYDKQHRCPRSSGAGWRGMPKKNVCPGGYITYGMSRAELSEHPIEWSDFWVNYPSKWKFGQCNKCDVRVLPLIQRDLTPSVMWLRMRRRITNWRIDRERKAEFRGRG